MDSKAFKHLLIALCCGFCMSNRLPQGGTQGFFKPVDSVRKAGEVVEFECRSPVGYSSLNFLSIDFVIKHNDVIWTETKPEYRETDDFARVIFDIADVSKLHAGNYTCHIFPGGQGKNVTFVTQLFIIEAEKKTYFVKKGNPLTLDCLSDVDHGFNPVVDWFVDQKRVGRDVESGMYTLDQQLFVTAAEKENARQDIQCNVTSKRAYEVYGSVSDALENGSGTGFQKMLSVIDVSTCEDVPCQLEARVYSETPVNIAWMLEGELLASSMVVNESVQTSTTVHLNSTVPVTLIITGGQNIWSHNVSILDNIVKPKPGPEPEKGFPVWAIILIVVTGIVIVIVIVIFCWRKQKNGQGQGGIQRDTAGQNGRTDQIEDGATEMSNLRGHAGAEAQDTTTQNGGTYKTEDDATEMSKLTEHGGEEVQALETTTQNGGTGQAEGDATETSKLTEREEQEVQKAEEAGWVVL